MIGPMAADGKPWIASAAGQGEDGGMDGDRDLLALDGLAPEVVLALLARAQEMAVPLRV